MYRWVGWLKKKKGRVYKVKMGRPGGGGEERWEK